TIDGGGQTFSTGGSFSLGGTIGQPDAGSPSAPLTGGSFELVGGFWPATLAVCSCPGDTNADGVRDGRDVRQFVTCILTLSGCNCADVDGVPGVTTGDVNVFVSALLAGAACP